MRRLLFLISGILFAAPALSQNPGDITFESAQIHTIAFTFSQTNYWDSLTYYHDLSESLNVNIYMKGDVAVDGVTYSNMGVKLKGNSSYNSYPGVKKSMKISFDEFDSTMTFDGMKQLNLNNGFKDPTMMREKIYLDFLEKQGIYAPRCTYANVYINGTLWGFYSLVEEIDKTFLKYHVGNKNGNLYKGDPQGRLTWMGSAQSSYYNNYELKTNEDVNDWSDLVELIDKINNTPSSDFKDSLETILNTDMYMRAWAGNNIFANLDSYLGSGHNYFIYHNTDTEKFDWLTWDVNEAFGNFNMGMSISQIEKLSVLFVPNPQDQRPLIKNMLDNSEYKSNYLDLIYQYCENDFSPWALNPVIDSIADVIRTHVYNDPNKMFTNQEFEDNIIMDITFAGPGGNIPGLKSFISNRRNNINSELISLGYPSLGIEDFHASDFRFEVYPNPASENATIRISLEKNENISLKLYDITGREIKKFSMENLPAGENHFSLDVSPLRSGLYFLTMQTGDNFKSVKLNVIE